MHSTQYSNLPFRGYEVNYEQCMSSLAKMKFKAPVDRLPAVAAQ